MNGTVAASHVYADDGNYTVTVTLVDSYGDFTSDTFTVTVLNVAPTVDAGPDLTDLNAAGEGSVVSLAPSTFNDLGTLDSHMATIDWGDGTALEVGVVTEFPFGPPGSTAGMDGEVDGSHVYADDGTYTVTVTVTDDDAGVGSDSFSVTVVNVAPTVEVINPNVVPVQYSDSINTITIHAWDIPTDDMDISLVTIFTDLDGTTFNLTDVVSVGPIELSDAGTIPGEVVLNGTNDQVSPDFANPAEWTISGIADLEPGDYTIEATITDNMGDTTTVSIYLTIAREHAVSTWVGPTFASSDPGSSKGEFTVELRAVVQDVTFFYPGANPDADPYGGDITRDDVPTGTVTFVITDATNDSPIATFGNVPVTPIDTDPLTGVAVMTWTDELGKSVDARTFGIKMIVDSFYTGEDETLLTVARPTGDFVTGGGYLVEENAYGATVTVGKTVVSPDGSTSIETRDLEFDAADGSKMNFGFNLKWNKRQTNLLGQFTGIVRADDGARWRIKSTATESLMVDPETGIRATVVSKANLINQATGESIGGLTLIVHMTDDGEPGSQEVNPNTIVGRCYGRGRQPCGHQTDLLHEQLANFGTGTGGREHSDSYR
jgi:PKD repeat protein